MGKQIYGRETQQLWWHGLWWARNWCTWDSRRDHVSVCCQRMCVLWMCECVCTASLPVDVCEVSWRRGATHDTSPPSGRLLTFCARPNPDSHPSIMDRSALTLPSFQKVWGCQKVGSCQAARRVCFLEEGFYARGWWIFRVGPVRILGSASTGHLQLHTQSVLIQLQTAHFETKSNLTWAIRYYEKSSFKRGWSQDSLGISDDEAMLVTYLRQVMW